jgi:DNA-binding NtrC family response regulator
MRARIVLVHDDQTFLGDLADGLRREGHDILTYDDPMPAWDNLRATANIGMLITPVQFAPGKPHGVALARWARASCPGVRIVFIARGDFEAAAEGLGIFLRTPVTVNDVIETVARLTLSRFATNDRVSNESAVGIGP